MLPPCAMINVQLEPNGSITQMEEAELLKTEGVVDNEREFTRWVEYRIPGQERPVHRSAHVTLKYSLTLMIDAGEFLHG